MEFHSSCTVEDLLGETTLVACEMSATVWEMNILWACLSLGLKYKLPFSSPGATGETSKFASILNAAV